MRADLANYEADAEAEADLEQEQLEPPYEAAESQGEQPTMAVSRAVLHISSSSDQEQRGRQPDEVPPLVARIQPRAEVSPDRQSLAVESEASAKTTTSRMDLQMVAFVNKEPSEPELIAEQRMGPGGQGDDDHRLTAAQPQLPMEQLMRQLGSMVQQTLEEQIAPALHQMMVHRATVESRLEQLEATSRRGSMDGELLAERTRLLNLAAERTAGTVRSEPAPVALSEGALGSAVHKPVAGPEAVEETSMPNRGSLFEGKSYGQSLGETGLPTQGLVWMGETQYAWQVKAGGLQLVPVAGPRDRESVRERARGREETARTSNEGVFGARALSPFQRVQPARSESGDLVREALGPQQNHEEPRPKTPDPKPQRALPAAGLLSPPTSGPVSFGPMNHSVGKAPAPIAYPAQPPHAYFEQFALTQAKSSPASPPALQGSGNRRNPCWPRSEANELWRARRSTMVTMKVGLPQAAFLLMSALLRLSLLQLALVIGASGFSVVLLAFANGL